MVAPKWTRERKDFQRNSCTNLYNPGKKAESPISIAWEVDFKKGATTPASEHRNEASNQGNTTDTGVNNQDSVKGTNEFHVGGGGGVKKEF
jgi:hypothetical protein